MNYLNTLFKFKGVANKKSIYEGKTYLRVDSISGVTPPKFFNETLKM